MLNNPLRAADPDGHFGTNHEFDNIGCDPQSTSSSNAFCNQGARDDQAELQYQTNTSDAYKAVQDAKDQNAEGQQQSGDATVPVVVGQRPIQNKVAQFFSILFTAHKAYHSYYRLAGDDGLTHQFEVLGDPGSSHNQQVRDTYGTARQSSGTEHTVYATEAQASALINRSEYFESNPCPDCTGGQEGYNLVFHNSNSFVFNMLRRDPAGSIPPAGGPGLDDCSEPK